MTPEIKALLEKARQSQLAAEALKRDDFPDFAAARAYYTMFYAAQALLLTRGLSFSSHSAVIAAFGSEFAKSGLLDPKFHRRLIDAQELRNLADYGIGPGVTDMQLQEVLAWSQEFLEVVEAWEFPD